MALFSPIKVGNLELKHRVVLAPLTRYRATIEAVPTDLMVEYYKQRATDGGLLISEATFINRLAGGFEQAPGIWNQEQIEGWKKITAAVHEKNSPFFMQLWHLGRAGFRHLNPNNEQIVSASAIRIPGKNPAGIEHEEPRALELDEIKALIQDYRQAALNAIEAGCDGVEVHSANGYLLDQFINSNSNKRTDIYGGSIENRCRLTLDVVSAVADAIGPERTSVRFSAGGFFGGVHDDTVVETWGYITRQLQERYPNLAYIHFIEARSNFRDDAHVNTSDSLDPYRAIWKGPFMISGGYSNCPQYSIDLAEKTGNLVSYGRAFISNPDLVERLRNNWPLTPYNRSTFYTHDAVGYTDYPCYKPDN